MLRDELDREFNQLATDVLYTEKSHFAAADDWGIAHVAIGLITTVAGAAAAATIVSAKTPGLAVALALVAAVGGALQTFLRPSDRRDAALKAGRELGALRVRLRQARSLRLPAAGEDALAEMANLASELAEQKAKIDAESPASTRFHYWRAKKKISSGEFESPRSSATDSSSAGTEATD